jgi:hypothetical protein
MSRDDDRRDDERRRRFELEHSGSVQPMLSATLPHGG